ncbi:MAG: sigma 54-interacting transcriptional regulator, partial [Bryobacterales bacterium]
MTDSSLNPTGGARRVQLVSPDCQDRDQVVSTLEAAGFRVDAVSRAGEARGRLPLLKPAIVLLDLSSELVFESASAYQELVAAANNLAQPVPLLLLTDNDRFDLAGELLRTGASDYLTKPFSPEDLLRRLSLALAAHRLVPRKPPGKAGLMGGLASGTALPPERLEPERLEPVLPAGIASPEQMLIGRSAAIRKVLDQVRLVAPKNTTVLITGETGTGKERVARAIHALSRRRGSALVSVNCGGIPANLLEDEFFGHVKGAFTDAFQPRLGRFEQAHHGTIFLDEIGD